MEDIKIEKKLRRSTFISAVEAAANISGLGNLKAVAEKIGGNSQNKFYNIKRGASTPFDTDAITLYNFFPYPEVYDILKEKFNVCQTFEQEQGDVKLNNLGNLL